MAEKAQAIHESFIMDQQMTAKDEQILRDTVPKAFLQRDEALHELSANLAEAARNEDTKGELQQFSEMTQSCVGCHSNYATGRFPGLKIPAQ